VWRRYLRPASVEEALALLREHAGQARIVAGGTDVVVELSRGVRPTETLIDITRLDELRYIREEEGELRLGALATHNDVIASALCLEGALPLAQACAEVGAPQIRARGTIAGNLITASPANDTIPPLMALDAVVVLASAAAAGRPAVETAPEGPAATKPASADRGAGEDSPALGKRIVERIVPLRDFYPGFRRTAMRPDELLREIRIPKMAAGARGLFLKLGLRRAQAISVIDLALVVALDGEIVTDAHLALGCLAPTIVRAPRAEAYLVGRRLDAETCAEAGWLAVDDAAPIDDVRGSAGYRRETLAALVADGLRRVAAGAHADGWMAPPVLLDTGASHVETPDEGREPFGGIIRATINGAAVTLPPEAARKTLLNALREDAGLTGAKEGCAEGECGACTVWLDGQAVMACLVPAAQAHGARVTTIEGLAATGPAGEAGLHPLQRAFIDCGAVQCGFCIPGMLMAGAKLLEERPRPDLAAIQVALSGNICRCTGYRKILDAVMSAAPTLPSPAGGGNAGEGERREAADRPAPPTPSPSASHLGARPPSPRGGGAGGEVLP